jgi:hypothetical protein
MWWAFMSDLAKKPWIEVIGQFEFLPPCITIEKIQTDQLPTKALR